MIRVITALGWEGLTPDQIRIHAEALDSAMQEFSINTPLRQAAFLAQIAHETGGFRWLRELGSAAYLRRYDGRADLGNIEAGDGARFRGRGYIQITGRLNYQQAGAALGYALLTQPELAEQPLYAARIASWWWKNRGLNAVADRGDFLRITKIINGGLSWLSDRERKYAVAKSVLLSTKK